MPEEELKALPDLSAAGSAALSAGDEAAFLAEQRDLGTRVWRLTIWAAALGGAVWWPTDFLFFREAPAVIHAFAIGRASTILIAIAFNALLWRLEFVRRHAAIVIPLVVANNYAVWGYEVGSLGAQRDLHFTEILFFMLFAIISAYTLVERLLVTGLFAAALTVPFLLPHWSELTTPEVARQIAIAAAVGSGTFVVGLVGDRLRRAAFIQRQLAAQGAAEVRRLNETLEHRVAEQTSELRQLANSVETARESERSHISRELHDELGQELTALRLETRYMRRRYEREPEAIGRNLQTLESLLERTSQTTRNIVADLRPRVLDDLGLGAATEWLVKRTEERSDLSCELQMTGADLPLPPLIATAAFRIIQESLTNVTRHARATRVTVRLLREGGRLEIAVDDDGRGIEEQRQVPGSGGAGLLGMRERAAALKGTLVVSKLPQKGTRVLAQLPIPAAAEAS